MVVWYRKNGMAACYVKDEKNGESGPYGIPPPQPPQGPFEKCAGCPYPSHGFICYSKDGSCLRTEIDKITKRSRKK